MVNFMDFYYTGPGTLAGRYLRKFWHPVCRAEDLQPGWAKPIKILGEEFTLYRGEGANLTSSISVVHTAKPNFRSAGSRTIAFAAAFTVGNTIAPGNASSSPPKRNPSPKRFAFAVVRRRNISN